MTRLKFSCRLVFIALRTTGVFLPLRIFGVLAALLPLTAHAQSAYIADQLDNTVSVLDTSTNSVTAIVSVGINPSGVAVTPDGTKVYVTNLGSGSVSVVESASNAVAGTIPVGGFPFGVAVTPDGARLYVSSVNSGKVSVLDTSSNTLIATVSVGFEAFLMAVTPDGARVYVSGSNGPGGPGTISVIETASNTVIATIPVGGSFTGGVAVTPDGAKLYVPISAIAVFDPNFQNLSDLRISAIDTGSNSVIATTHLGSFNAAFEFGRVSDVAMTPDGSKAYVATDVETMTGTRGFISVINTASDSVIATIPLISNGLLALTGVAVTPDGAKAFVISWVGLQGLVWVIDTASDSVIDTVPVSGRPVAIGISTGSPKSNIIDPVPQLLFASGLTTAATAAQALPGQPFLADLTLGREVKGVAADGVAQVVLRIPAKSVGETFEVSVRSNQCVGLSATDCVDDYGLVFSPINPPSNVFGNTPVQTIVDAVATAKGPMAFAAYRAPIDFVRSGAAGAADVSEAKRSVFLSITSQQNGIKPDIEIQVVRPPVVFVHGFNAGRDAWADFEPQFNQSLFKFYRVQYGDAFPYPFTAGTYVPTQPLSNIHRPKNSHFGLEWNGLPVITQIKKFINLFRISNPAIPVAASRADVIAHSMGGLITKYASQQLYYKTSANYGVGFVHKLITLGTPYFGSPQAKIQLAEPTATQAGSSCSRFLAATPPPLGDTFSISSFTPSGRSPIIGAVNDLQGRGDGASLSSVLQVVNSSAARTAMPTAVIAGKMDFYLQNVNDTNALGLLYSICGPTTVVRYLDDTTNGLTDTTVPGFVTSIQGGVMHRERGGDVTIPTARPGFPLTIVGRNENDSYAFYLTTPRFRTQFDPSITLTSAALGQAQVDSDASVPLLSAQGGYNVTTVLPAHLHSGGWNVLIRSTTNLSLTHLQNSPTAAKFVEILLNKNVKASAFNQ